MDENNIFFKVILLLTAYIAWKLLDKLFDYGCERLLKNILNSNEKYTKTLKIIRNHAPRMVSFSIVVLLVSYFSVRVALTTAGLSVRNGNVGIGSTMPGQLLDVQGTVRSTGLNVNSLGTAFTILNANVGIGSANPGALLDLNGGRMRTVGIGTSVPEPSCIKSDGTQGYYNTSTWQGTCL